MRSTTSAATGTPFGARDRFDLAAAGEELRLDDRIAPHRADRQPRGAGEAGERGEEDELLPDRHAAVVGGERLDVGAGERLVNLLDARAEPREFAENLAEHDPPMRAGLHDQARALERGGDVSGPAERPLFAGDASRLRPGLSTPFWTREHGGRVAEQRRQQRQRRRVVVGLDRESTTIDRADMRGVFLGAAARDGSRRAPGSALQAALANRGWRCAPRAMNVTSWPACASFAP